MNKRFRTLWIVPCAVLVLLLCFFLDEREEQKSDIAPYLLSFSDNCAGYADDTLCELDALTPWDWDTVWFLPAGPGAPDEVELPDVEEEIELEDAVGDTPAAYCLAFVKDGELVYLLSDQCADAGYRMNLDEVPNVATGSPLHCENDQTLVLRKTPAEGGQISLLTLQRPVAA